MTSVPRRPGVRRPIRRAIVLAVLAASSVAGCSSATHRSTGPPTVDSLLPVNTPSMSAAPTLDTLRGLALPTEAYRPTAAQRNTIADAVNAKITECMRQFGFTWTTRSAHLPAPNQVDRLYGVSDLATAQRFGYHLPSADTRPGDRPSTGASLSPFERLALSGKTTGANDSPGSYRGKPVPAGGCAAQARAQAIGVDDVDPTHVADAITVGMWEKSKTDPHVVAVITAWSDCMKQAGYRYSSPLDAGSDRPEWLRAETPGVAEIRAAVADVRCKQSTNLIGIWFTVESAYENEAIRLHLPQLTQIREQWADAAARAAGGT